MCAHVRTGRGLAFCACVMKVLHRESRVVVVVSCTLSESFVRYLWTRQSLYFIIMYFYL